MDGSTVKEILADISTLKIAVYGDLCLDVYCKIIPGGSEISVETGKPADAVESFYSSPGGASNVLANAAALQPAEVVALGVIGSDMHGRELIRHFHKAGIKTSQLTLQKKQFDTYAFLKVYNKGVEVSRTDFGFENKRSEETDYEILRNIRKALEQYQVLIFNQQVPGSITRPEFLYDFQKLIDAFPDRIVVIDSRHLKTLFKGAYYKTNESEIFNLRNNEKIDRDRFSKGSVTQQAASINNSSKKPVFVTMGSKGILVVDHENLSKVPGLNLTGKLDTVGAGDTVISALALSLATGIEPVTAAQFANLAAGVTVQKLFTTGTASADEIIAMADHDL